jgi:hypothetical protein
MRFLRVFMALFRAALCGVSGLTLRQVLAVTEQRPHEGTIAPHIPAKVAHVRVQLIRRS